jgi:hypothetical protein
MKEPAGAGSMTFEQESTMRFMIMHKNDAGTEAGQKPPMELVHKMGALMGEYAQSGRFIDGAGLGASRTRTRLVFRDGQCTTKRGPYGGEHELPAATLLLKVRTREEAIGWAERYGKILGDGELEVGRVNEPWDIGLGPEPENPPLQMSKELIGGFAVMELEGMDEAVALSRRYAAILGGTLEIDVRLVDTDEGAV